MPQSAWPRQSAVAICILNNIKVTAIVPATRLLCSRIMPGVAHNAGLPGLRYERTIENRITGEIDQDSGFGVVARDLSGALKEPSMKLTDFVVPGAVIPSLQVSNKEAAIRGMVDSLVQTGNIKSGDADGI
ncbi:MAG: hypothetical protein JWN70_1867, partial [Planctomycetaceae bacterium]|nr:hypothetical protein [Planctomycetaceae bacterium]